MVGYLADNFPSGPDTDAQLSGSDCWEATQPSPPGDTSPHGARNAAGRVHPSSKGCTTEAALTLSVAPEDQMAAVPQLRRPLSRLRMTGLPHERQLRANTGRSSTACPTGHIPPFERPESARKRTEPERDSCARSCRSWEWRAASPRVQPSPVGSIADTFVSVDPKWARIRIGVGVSRSLWARPLRLTRGTLSARHASFGNQRRQAERCTGTPFAPPLPSQST